MDIDDRMQVDGNSASSTQVGAGVQRSIEGYVICATNLHEEATEDDMHEIFSEDGPYRNLHLNLDRSSGYCKGYVLAEYSTYEEARSTILRLSGSVFMGRRLIVDFAFADSSVQGMSRILRV